MKKNFAAASAIALVLSICPLPAFADEGNQDVVYGPYIDKNISLTPEQEAIAAELLKERIAYQKELKANTDLMNKALKSLNKYVGKTWYVFSGNTPSGWDCSGLTMWFYEQQGIELEHRASKQTTAGDLVENPKPGDLVSFFYKGNKTAYHVGIYIGDGKMIHAPKRGHVTSIDSVERFGGSYSKIKYTRIIETS